MKKTFIFLAATLALCATAFAARPKKKSVGSGKLKIVTTIFPEYDWTMQLLGEKSQNADVTLLLDNGVDLHSFQPTAWDILTIANADLFIYVGGESDEWVEDALEESPNKNRITINLLEVLGNRVKTEEITEGMQYEHDSHDGDEPEYDEHVWLSLKNAQILCAAIADALCRIDAENASAYSANLEVYASKLAALDSEYTSSLCSAKYNTLVFGDRFPFRYLTDDYGLKYFAAFVGCSAETEASFKTIIFLASKLDELSLPSVFTIENSDGKLARTIVQSTKNKNAKTYALNSMQSTTSRDVKNGISYLGIMENNLAVLKAALN